jgi:hypothetical protein
MAVSVRLWVFYQLKTDGSRATGLTVTLDVDKYHRTTGVRSRVETGVSAVEGANGVYSYTVANVSDIATYDYVGVFMTAATTVIAKDLPSLQQDFVAALSAVLTYLDAAVSTRLAAASYSAAPTAEANADAVWDEALSGHTTTGTAGKTLATAGAATDPWLNEVPGSYVAPQSGYYISRLALNTVALTANFDPETKEMRYRYGDDYSAVENRSTVFTTLLDLTNGGVNWNVRTESGLVVVPCTLLGAHSYDLGPTAAQIMAVGVGVWPYDLEMSLSNGHTVTEIAGTVAIAEDVR